MFYTLIAAELYDHSTCQLLKGENYIKYSCQTKVLVNYFHKKFEASIFPNSISRVRNLRHHRHCQPQIPSLGIHEGN